MASVSDNVAPVCLKDTTNSVKNSDKIIITLDGVAKTLLIPLIARAYDNTLPEPILGDPYAKDVVDKIEFDIDKMPSTPVQNAGISLRTRHFDQWAESMLKMNPNTTVLNLACGFDSRMQRVKWDERARWIDIDLPEVIELRKKVLPVSLPERDYSLIGVDILDESWMRNIVQTSGPVLVIMEGLLSYLPEEDVKRLLQRICETFSEGDIIFECVSSAVLSWLNCPESIKAVSNTGAVFKSAIDDPIALEALHPLLRLAESVSLVQAPGIERFSLLVRMRMYLSSWLQSGRDSVRFLHFRFGQEKALS